MTATVERRWKRSGLDDIAVIQAVEDLNNEHDCWTFTGYVAERFPDAPFKIVAAKLKRLLALGFVTGCPCGCRGDWEVTSKVASSQGSRRNDALIRWNAKCRCRTGRLSTQRRDNGRRYQSSR